jgi:hypothetical protein
MRSDLTNPARPVRVLPPRRNRARRICQVRDSGTQCVRLLTKVPKCAPKNQNCALPFYQFQQAQRELSVVQAAPNHVIIYT